MLTDLRFLRQLHMALLSVSLSLTLSLPVLAVPAELTQLSQELSVALENYLKSTLKREKIGVEIIPVALPPNDDIFQLSVPNHVQRDTLFQVKVRYQQGYPVLEGRVYSAAEQHLLAETAQKIFTQGVKLQLEHFPYSQIDPDYAISIQPGSSLYVKPMAVAGDNLATQIRLGTPLEILQYSEDRKFALVRVVDDGYIAWIQRSHLLETSLETFQSWRLNRQVLLMQTVSSPRLLYLGTRLRLLEKHRDRVLAALPDGTPLQLPAEAVRIEAGPPAQPNLEAVIRTAQQYLPQGPQGGGPYLWGGTLGKSLDCSGFIQTIFRVNGIYLPRDADQQMYFTQRVANSLKDLSELKPGDLVFFSGNRKYPTHVGLYLGAGKIIHSSPKGAYSGIKINTLQGGGEYDRYLQGIYFGGGRVTRSL